MKPRFVPGPLRLFMQPAGHALTGLARRLLRSPSALWSRLGLSSAAALVGATLLSVACGGGVEVGGTGTALGFTEGPISGYGSIIVNGVHYDESSATVTDDNGQSLSADSLKLGMVVRIDAGSPNAGTGVAVASQVQTASDLLGPVATNDLSAGTLTVLGQTVKITASTVFGDTLVSGQSAISLGAVVEVHAIRDPVSGRYLARRIDATAATPTAYKLRGPVSANQPSQREFQIGAATLTYASGAAPADLADGVTLKLLLATTPDSHGRWVVTAGAKGQRQPSHGAAVRIESAISTFTSASHFSLGGLVVDASSATVLPAGTTLALGSRVEVEGSMSGTVLVATRVTRKTEDDDDGSGGSGSNSGQEFEIKGNVTSVLLAEHSFTVRGTPIRYDSATAFDKGTAADLARLPKVEVKGRLLPDRHGVLASQIKFVD